MLVTNRFISMAIPLLLLDSIVSFQVSNSDPDQSIKRIIENSTKQRIVNHPITTIPYDDAISEKSTVTNIIQTVMSKVNLSDDCSRPLHEVISAPFSIPSSLKGAAFPGRRKIRSTRYWPFFDDDPEYWFNHRIHSFGNTGLFGSLHALCAPLATKLIDEKAYGGINVRFKVAHYLRSIIHNPRPTILDLGCGVGMSTRALCQSFDDSKLVLGVDTSPEMIDMAKKITQHDFAVSSLLRTNSFPIPDWVSPLLVTETCDNQGISFSGTCLYAQGNAERLQLPSASFDLVTIMYAFHEIPFSARYRILREARRLLKDGGTLAVVDIHRDLIPLPSMLVGEPYVSEYLKNFHQQIESLQGFVDYNHSVIIDKHVSLWTFTRCRNKMNAYL